MKFSNSFSDMQRQVANEWFISRTARDQHVVSIFSIASAMYNSASSADASYFKQSSSANRWIYSAVLNNFHPTPWYTKSNNNGNLTRTRPLPRQTKPSSIASYTRGIHSNLKKSTLTAWEMSKIPAAGIQYHTRDRATFHRDTIFHLASVRAWNRNKNGPPVNAIVS